MRGTKLNDAHASEFKKIWRALADHLGLKPEQVMERGGEMFDAQAALFVICRERLRLEWGEIARLMKRTKGFADHMARAGAVRRRESPAIDNIVAAVKQRLGATREREDAEAKARDAKIDAMLERSRNEALYGTMEPCHAT